MDTIKEFQERISGLINSYYNNAEDAKTKREVFTNLLSDFSKDLYSHLEKVKKDRAANFFPKSSHNHLDVQQIGIEETKAAYIFLDSPRTKDTIKNQIDICKNLGQIDYLSTIFQKLNEQIPKSKSQWELLKLTNRDNYEFFLFIEAEYKNFTSKSGIDFLESKIKLLNEIKQKMDGFSKTILN